jgi:hypothetical protein
MKPIIYVSLPTGKSFFKITMRSGARKNIGCIEHTGHLNVKQAMFAHGGPNFKMPPASINAKNGRTHGVGGVGYHSYAQFPKPASAKAYLRKFFTVRVK